MKKDIAERIVEYTDKKFEMHWNRFYCSLGISKSAAKIIFDQGGTAVSDAVHDLKI